MDFTPSLKAKKFYRFTGPPEHWLTAIKYMTWGLNKNKESSWKKIQTGDIFFIHSTGASLFKNAKSGIIGIGVVGANFSIKDNFLWLREQRDNQNIWPFLVPLSEIYLFSELTNPDRWENPNLKNQSQTENLIEQLLKNSIPLSNIKGFPQMGSLSSVSDQVAQQILFNKKPLYLYATKSEDSIISSKPTPLEKINRAEEAFRYADSLEVFDAIKTRVVKEGSRIYRKNNELLAKAEIVHATVIQKLIDVFKKNGYETLFNKYIDLFAHNGNKAFLVEVKSTENKNFRSQARKGIVQLYEYDYFEIERFIKEKDIKFKEKHKILVPSQEPKDNKYIDFINFLNIGVGMVNGNIRPIGKDFGFSKL